MLIIIICNGTGAEWEFLQNAIYTHISTRYIQILKTDIFDYVDYIEM